MRAGDPASTPPRESSAGGRGARLVALAGTALALAVLLAAAAAAWYQRQEQMQAEQQRSELLARVLEDHATRSIETASLALTALADVVARSDGAGDTQIGSLLGQTVVGLPVLRGMAVLDAQGQVLASSVAAEQGLAIDLRRLGSLPPPDVESTGALIAGRGLGELAIGRPAGPVPEGVAFVPLLRNVLTRLGQQRLVLALINPDAVANYQQQLLADESRSALLATFDGQVLAASGLAAASPGQRLDALPVFSQFLPGTEHGSYVGQGSTPGARLVAFRASRTRPLVLVVETPLAQALAPWRRDATGLAALAALMASIIGGLTFTTVRSLKAREAARAQRDAAQEQVALRERELSVIFRSVQELLFRTDARGRLSFVNARWQAATGYPEAQAIGHALADLVRPESAAAAAALFAGNGATGMRSARLLLGPATEVRHFEVALVPLRSGSETVGFAGSAVDVTAQHQAQQLLQAQLRFTELLLEVLPLPLAIVDTDGRHVSVNQAWEAFTGLPRSEVIGRRADTWLPAAEAQAHAAQDAELLQRGGSLRYEATSVHRDGTRRDLALTKAMIPGSDGRAAGILVAFMDVSEFRQAERTTREARDAAEEASRTKSEFVANISHELRTPLQVILGFSELGRLRSGDQPRLGAMFGDIHAAGQRMLALVNDLLDVSKLESTVGTLHLERTDVRGLVREVVSELQPLLIARHLLVDVDLGPLPLVAKVDPSRFQQVVRNVMANAIRLSPTGETLALSGRLLDDQRIELCVRDHGPGIPAAELERIFEAFVQSSNTRDTAGGTGLGLAICRRILQALGGEIDARNNPDRGATFCIRLPARGLVEGDSDLGA